MSDLSLLLKRNAAAAAAAAASISRTASLHCGCRRVLFSLIFFVAFLFFFVHALRRIGGKSRARRRFKNSSAFASLVSDSFLSFLPFFFLTG